MSLLEKFQLHGKTALVTGCRRGIGEAIAVGLAEAGADIIGVSATLEPHGSGVETKVRALGRAFTGSAANELRVPHATVAKVAKHDFPVAAFATFA